MKIKTNAKEVTGSVKSAYRHLLTEITVFLNRLSKYGLTRAEINFANVKYAGENDAKISVVRKAQGFQLIAKGQSILFIEFGTGIKYTDPHPLANTYGFERGDYGLHKGLNPNGWYYTGDPGTAGTPVPGRNNSVHTYGNPANRSMFNTSEELRQKISDIAREVFQ